jgi:hypothetical protein
MNRTTKYLGSDVHQATSGASVREESGRVITRTLIPTEEAALLEFFRSVGDPEAVHRNARASRARARQPPGSLHTGVQARLRSLQSSIGRAGGALSEPFLPHVRQGFSSFRARYGHEMPPVPAGSVLSTPAAVRGRLASRECGHAGTMRPGCR